MELTDYIRRSMDGNPRRRDISLSAALEVFAGNYYVSGEGGGNPDVHWLAVYYDASVDPDTEAVEMVPAHLTAYVSSDYRWGFVLSGHAEKFRQDVSDYGIVCVTVPDFESELLQCARRDLLPEEFSGVVWIDDDFLDDETIPFDFDSFYRIDGGIAYLNPGHFSVSQLVRIMEHGTDSRRR